MRAVVIGMDSGMMGVIMMVMVLLGMALSVTQLIAEIIFRGRVTECQAHRDLALRELYSKQPVPAASQTGPSTKVAA